MQPFRVFSFLGCYVVKYLLIQRHRVGCAVLSCVAFAITCAVPALADSRSHLAMDLQTDRAVSQASPPAQPAERAGLRLRGVHMSPFSRPRPGRLFTIRTTVLNESSEERAGLVLARIDRAPELQAAAEVHIPPGESRLVDLRLRVPSDIEPGSGFDLSFSLNSLDGERVLLLPSGQPQIDSLRMTVDNERIVTALMLEDDVPYPPEWAWPQHTHVMPYECAIAARIDTGFWRQTASLTHDNYPTQMVDWDGFDVVFLARSGPLSDPAVMQAMGRWLAAGGRGWIMLDRVGQDGLSNLLPDGMTCETIDDIELNEFVVEADLAISLSQADRTVTSEKPLRLRRVVQQGATVTHRINGFPAAMWFNVGKGQLLVTTLDAAGLVEPRTGQRSTEPLLNSDFQMRAWAKPLAEQIYEGPDLRSPLEAAQIDYPLKHVGNPVLNRNFVISVVFGFCGLLALAGWWCWHTGSLTRMGWLVPLISAGAALPLLVASNRVRSEVPDTSAHLQLIEVQPGSRSIQGTQWTATYMSRSDSAKLVADGDAMVTWPLTGDQNELRRWLWDDYQHWQLSSASWPRGLWRLDARFGLQPRPLDVTARIDSNGLSIEVPAELGEPLEDAVLSYVPGDVAVCNQVDVDEVTAVPEAHVTAGQSWLDTTIVNDEQSRRDEIYRLLTSRTALSRYPSYPALLGWTKLWKTPVTWSEPRDERGAALVVLPIKLQPVATGETIYVPHTVVRVETPAEGLSRSTAFSNHSGLWREETTIAMQVPIRFHLPREVCPIEASEIICDLQMRAPQRDVHITSSAGDKETVVAEFRSPLSAERIRITDPAILSDARDGSVNFQIDISTPIGQTEADFGSQIANWQIDYVRISVNGRVLDR